MRAGATDAGDSSCGSETADVTLGKPGVAACASCIQRAGRPCGRRLDLHGRAHGLGRSRPDQPPSSKGSAIPGIGRPCQPVEPAGPRRRLGTSSGRCRASWPVSMSLGDFPPSHGVVSKAATAEQRGFA